MSREIKFRAWQTNVGYYNKETKEFIQRPKYFYGRDVILDGNGQLLSVESGWDIQGAEEPKDYILEQYTGLKDKNGKEVYEGDIARADVGWYNGKPHPRYFSKAIVIFRQQAFMLVDSIENTTHNEPLWNYASEELEVIGNIHENPELLYDAIHDPYGPIGEENIGGESGKMQR